MPRRWASLARVVRLAEVEKLEPIRNGEDVERLEPYVKALEQGPDSPAPARWLNPRTLVIDSTIATGEALAVQVTYDPNWRATSASHSFPVVKDVLGQTRILAPPGQHHIELYWETPLENRIGRGLFALAVLICGWLCWRGRRR